MYGAQTFGVEHLLQRTQVRLVSSLELTLWAKYHGGTSGCPGSAGEGVGTL